MAKGKNVFDLFDDRSPEPTVDIDERAANDMFASLLSKNAWRLMQQRKLRESHNKRVSTQYKLKKEEK